MADNFGEGIFEKLLEQLTLKYNVIESIKTQEDGICEDLRLLLKPWPRPKSEKTANKLSPAVVHRDEVKKPPEVVLAEKALAKAEKTRSRFKEKVMVLHPEETGNEDLPKHEDIKQEDISSILHAEPGLTSSETPTDPVLVQYDASSTQDTYINSLNPQPEIAVIPQSQLNRLLESHAGHQIPNKGTRMVNAKSAKPMTTSRAPSRGTKQGIASQGRFTPAYKAAPFQTAAPVKKQKPGLTRAQMLRANANASKIHTPPSSGFSSAKTRTSHKIGQGLSQPRVSSASRDQRLRNSHLTKGGGDNEGQKVISKVPKSGKEEAGQKPSVLSSRRPNHHQSSGRSNTVEVRHGQGNIDSVDMEGLERKLAKGLSLGGYGKNENTNNNGNNNPCDECKEREEGGEDLPFVLQRDGKKLNLPQKLIRLMGSNRKMRVKLKSAGITKRAQETVSARDQFLHRMDQYFSESFREDQEGELHNRMKLCDEYHRLYGIFKQICQTSLSEKTSWQTVLKCKRHIEHVFVRFTELEDQYWVLCSRKDHQVPLNCEFKEIMEKLVPKDDVSPSFWLSRQLLPDSLTLSSVVWYEKRQELSEYISLLHKLQTLAWELYVMEETAKQVLPYLRQTNCDNQSEGLQLYRCAYSILCSRGTTLPAIVHDSEESDKSLTDDNSSDTST